MNHMEFKHTYDFTVAFCGSEKFFSQLRGKYELSLSKKRFLGDIKKVKCSRYSSGVAQRVDRGIALLFHDRGTGRG